MALLHRGKMACLLHRYSSFHELHKIDPDASNKLKILENLVKLGHDPKHKDNTMSAEYMIMKKTLEIIKKKIGYERYNEFQLQAIDSIVYTTDKHHGEHSILEYRAVGQVEKIKTK
jgi:hypothetical protein